MDDENAGRDDENSSTESVEALSNNQTPEDAVSQATENERKTLRHATQNDEKTSQSNEDNENNDEREESDPCTCSDEVSFY